MNTKSSRIIGVDVGGTKILLQTFDEKMNLVEEEKVFTEVKKGQAGFTQQLLSLLQKYFHPKIKSIGVALPGILDRKKGILVRAPHLPVKNLKLKQILSKHFKCSITVGHDGHAFLYAQSQRPILRKYKNLIAVMPGTGLGGAIMIDGKLVYGEKGFAGEIGHMILNGKSPLASFEQNTSGAFIPKIAQQLGLPNKFAPFDLAKKSPEEKKIKKHLIEYLGLGLANLNLIFNPAAFVLGGSIYMKFLTDSKKDLQKIISKYALDGTAPPLFDADKKYTAAMGIALVSSKS